MASTARAETPLAQRSERPSARRPPEPSTSPGGAFGASAAPFLPCLAISTTRRLWRWRLPPLTRVCGSAVPLSTRAPGTAWPIWNRAAAPATSCAKVSKTPAPISSCARASLARAGRRKMPGSWDSAFRMPGRAISGRVGARQTASMAEPRNWRAMSRSRRRTRSVCWINTWPSLARFRAALLRS
jgi:hypothetical protein